MSNTGPVEEYQLLFSEDNEDGVTKFRNLGEDEHPGPEPTDSVSLDEAVECVKG